MSLSTEAWVTVALAIIAGALKLAKDRPQLAEVMRTSLAA